MTIVCEHCNLEFSTKDKRQKYCSKACYFQTRTGENNFFHKYKQPEEIRAREAKKQSELFKGSGNPFYGKKHTEEALEKVREGNRKYREQNKELIEQRLLSRLNLNEEKIKFIFQEYRDTHETLLTLQEKYAVDQRVLKKYFLKYACTQQELETVIFNKKYKNASSVGEETLFLLLCKEFGQEKVKRQFKLSFYYYDFLIDDKLLIEYDGYYWHVLVESNDEQKDKVAEESAFKLYRVRENEKRKVDFLIEIQKIREVYNEIQTQGNPNN
jgi:hypothetical protein